MRKRWLAASAPPSTKAAATSVIALAPRSANTSLPTSASTASSASFTRTAVTVGKETASALMSVASSAVVPPSAKVSVAISLCGAPSKMPGEKTSTKLTPRFSQSTARRLAMQIAVDLHHGHQDREPKAERQHHARRQCAGAMQIGDRQPQHSRFLPRRMPRNPHDERRGQPQQQEHRCGSGEEKCRDAPI